MITAAAHVVDDYGYGGMSVARVTARAGVSRRTFYDVFEDRENCFVAVFDEAVERARMVAVRAAAGGGSWRERVRAGLAALLVFAGDDPVTGSLLIVHALGAGPKTLSRRARGLETLHAIIDQGRSQTKAGKEPPPLTAEGTVGAVLSVIHARLLEPDHGPLIDLLNPLMGMIVLPYLGPVAAAKELTRPAPKTKHGTMARAKNPLDGLRMRLTYRTLRVLSAIATLPDASNREIADHAGVSDQGQISKLLARLERLELIHNTGPNTKGEPNAWQLTPKGHEIQHAVGITNDQTSHTSP
jgi:AcrR family transcriptional regulator/DNA-binding MarR family transcriptional regulator